MKPTNSKQPDSSIALKERQNPNMSSFVKFDTVIGSQRHESEVALGGTVRDLSLVGRKCEKHEQKPKKKSP